MHNYRHGIPSTLNDALELIEPIMHQNAERIFNMEEKKDIEICTLVVVIS